MELSKNSTVPSIQVIVLLTEKEEFGEARFSNKLISSILTGKGKIQKFEFSFL